MLWLCQFPFSEIEESQEASADISSCISTKPVTNSGAVFKMGIHCTNKIISERAGTISEYGTLFLSARDRRQTELADNIWTFSLAGQSIRLITGRSTVQIREGPLGFGKAHLRNIDSASKEVERKRLPALL